VAGFGHTEGKTVKWRPSQNTWFVDGPQPPRRGSIGVGLRAAYRLTIEKSRRDGPKRANLRARPVEVQASRLAPRARQAFPRGQNSHDGVVFRRGPDIIPRGSVVGLLRAVWDDDGDLAQELLSLNGAKLPYRAPVARAFILAANDVEHPLIAIASVERMADRLDGRPKQATETRPQRVTIMYRRGDPPPWLPKEVLPPSAQAAATPEVTAPTEPTREPDLVPMEGPPEGPFSR
jgi:hypothetical protein